jgi:hypothetical protein
LSQLKYAKYAEGATRTDEGILLFLDDGDGAHSCGPDASLLTEHRLPAGVWLAVCSLISALNGQSLSNTVISGLTAAALSRASGSKTNTTGDEDQDLIDLHMCSIEGHTVVTGRVVGRSFLKTRHLPSVVPSSKHDTSCIPAKPLYHHILISIFSSPLQCS